MAGNVTAASDPSADTTTEPIGSTMARWQRLFGLGADDAVERIQEHRQDLTRLRITDEHWEAVRTDMERQGYDEESYECSLQLERKAAVLQSAAAAPQDEQTDPLSYLLELSGPFSSAARVQQIANLQQRPRERSGRSLEDGREVRLCCIDARTKAAVLQWARNEGRGYEPTILVDPRSIAQ